MKTKTRRSKSKLTTDELDRVYCNYITCLNFKWELQQPLHPADNHIISARVNAPTHFHSLFCSPEPPLSTFIFLTASLQLLSASCCPHLSSTPPLPLSYWFCALLLFPSLLASHGLMYLLRFALLLCSLSLLSSLFSLLPSIRICDNCGAVWSCSLILPCPCCFCRQL